MHQFRNPVYSRLLKKLSSIFVLFSGEGVVVLTDYSLQRFACVSLKARLWRYPQGRREDCRKEREIGASRRVTKGGEGKGNWLWELIPPVNPVSSVIYINVGDETVTDCLWLHSHTICNSYSAMVWTPIRYLTLHLRDWRGAVPRGGTSVIFLLGMCRWHLRASTPFNIVYSVANYRPHLSHFWANMEFSQSQLSNFLFMYLP